MHLLDNTTEVVPALPDLFISSESGTQLIGARCKSCNTHFFPAYHEQHRPGCKREEIEEVLLSSMGKLTSFTVQHYMPPPPFKTQEDITPYTLGLVEFPEGIQVAGIIVEPEPKKLMIGARVETTTFPLYQNDENQSVVTWAFKLIME